MAESEANEVEHKGNRPRSRGKPAVRKVPAVTRAIAILRLLGRSKEPLGVNRIARELGLVPSTALHILRALMAEEFVAFDENTKRYELDVGMLAISESAVRRNSFIQAVQPGLDHLSEKFGLTMLAAKIMGLDHAVVVAICTSSLPFRLHTDIGNRFPALISASGRCLAAFGDYEKNDLEKRFKELKWANPPSLSEWWDQVRQTRQTGYGLDEGNFLAGVTVIAVPFMDSGRMTHSVVAVGMQDQFVDLGIDRVASELRKLVDQLGSEAG